MYESTVRKCEKEVCKSPMTFVINIAKVIGLFAEIILIKGECMELIQIAHIENGYKAKFGIPRQSGLATAVESRIVMEKEYGMEEAFRGIERITVEHE